MRAAGGTRQPLGLEPDLLERPPGLVFHALFIIVCVHTLACASLPGWDGLETFFALYAWLIAGTLWSSWLAIYGFLHVRRRVTPVQHSRLRWFFVPLCTAVTLALLVFDVPLHVRFGLSRGALEREARQEFQAPVPPSPGEELWPARRIGLFRVADREAEQGVVRFRVEGAGFLCFGSGFAYAPAGQPTSPTEVAYDSIGDGWFVWSRND